MEGIEAEGIETKEIVGAIITFDNGSKIGNIVGKTDEQTEFEYLYDTNKKLMLHNVKLDDDLVSPFHISDYNDIMILMAKMEEHIIKSHTEIEYRLLESVNKYVFMEKIKQLCETYNIIPSSAKSILDFIDNKLKLNKEKDNEYK